MTRKTSEARREAFFRALAATGNRTIAAERAKVSRSWVTLHRAEEPGFRERMEAAVAEARASLDRLRTNEDEDGRKASVRPPSGWGSLDGEELVVRGGNGRRTQIARARLRQWTPRAEARFLGVLAATCNVRAACAEVGLSVPSAYLHARRWQGFADRWQAAIETGYLRIEAGLLAQVDDSNPFSARDVDPDVPIEPMSAWVALGLLKLYQRRVHGVGQRTGGAPRRPPRSLDELRPGILRKWETLEGARRARAELPSGLLAADRRAWAKRRAEPEAGEAARDADGPEAAAGAVAEAE